MRIAVDAMGGDRGPAVIVEGAVDAVREHGAQITLVGDKSVVERELSRLGAMEVGIAIRHASQVVEMGESPSVALRRKRNSSIRIAADLVKEGEASALVSAGNTGAAMAIARFVLGALPGVDRPAIAVVLPNLHGRTVLIDAGANVDPKPRHLFQFGLMGHVYARDLLGISSPRVGLLSIGEEEGKGTDLTREAFKELESSSLNFIGNVEGRDIYNGNADVVVTDGFTGNVCLKISESLAEMIGALIREELTRNLASKLGALLVKPAFRRFQKRVDYNATGGAPLLGINGACIISHGASPARAIKSAIRVATEWVTSNVNAHILAALDAEYEGVPSRIQGGGGAGGDAERGV